MTLIDRITAALDGATPGPWAVIHDRPFVSIVRADDEDQRHSPIFDISTGDDDEAPITPDMRLAALAPEMAEFITGLRQEWAVIEYTDADEEPRGNIWYSRPEPARLNLTEHPAPNARLVSRWVSEPEVIE